MVKIPHFVSLTNKCNQFLFQNLARYPKNLSILIVLPVIFVMWSRIEQVHRSERARRAGRVRTGSFELWRLAVRRATRLLSEYSLSLRSYERRKLRRDRRN